MASPKGSLGDKYLALAVKDGTNFTYLKNKLIRVLVAFKGEVLTSPCAIRTTTTKFQCNYAWKFPLEEMEEFLKKLPYLTIEVKALDKSTEEHVGCATVAFTNAQYLSSDKDILKFFPVEIKGVKRPTGVKNPRLFVALALQDGERIKHTTDWHAATANDPDKYKKERPADINLWKNVQPKQEKSFSQISTSLTASTPTPPSRPASTKSEKKTTTIAQKKSIPGPSAVVSPKAASEEDKSSSEDSYSDTWTITSSTNHPGEDVADSDSSSKSAETTVKPKQRLSKLISLDRLKVLRPAVNLTPPESPTGFIFQKTATESPHEDPSVEKPQIASSESSDGRKATPDSTEQATASAHPSDEKSQSPLSDAQTDESELKSLDEVKDSTPMPPTTSSEKRPSYKKSESSSSKSSDTRSTPRELRFAERMKEFTPMPPTPDERPDDKESKSQTSGNLTPVSKLQSLQQREEFTPKPSGVSSERVTPGGSPNDEKSKSSSSSKSSTPHELTVLESPRPPKTDYEESDRPTSAGSTNRVCSSDSTTSDSKAEEMPFREQIRRLALKATAAAKKKGLTCKSMEDQKPFVPQVIEKITYTPVPPPTVFTPTDPTKKLFLKPPSKAKSAPQTTYYRVLDSGPLFAPTSPEIKKQYQAKYGYLQTGGAKVIPVPPDNIKYKKKHDKKKKEEPHFDTPTKTTKEEPDKSPEKSPTSDIKLKAQKAYDDWIKRAFGPTITDLTDFIDMAEKRQRTASLDRGDHLDKPTGSVKQERGVPLTANTQVTGETEQLAYDDWGKPKTGKPSETVKQSRLTAESEPTGERDPVAYDDCRKPKKETPTGRRPPLTAEPELTGAREPATYDDWGKPKREKPAESVKQRRESPLTADTELTGEREQLAYDDWGKPKIEKPAGRRPPLKAETELTGSRGPETYDDWGKPKRDKPAETAKQGPKPPSTPQREFQGAKPAYDDWETPKSKRQVDSGDRPAKQRHKSSSSETESQGAKSPYDDWGKRKSKTPVDSKHQSRYDQHIKTHKPRRDSSSSERELKDSTTKLTFAEWEKLKAKTVAHDKNQPSIDKHESSTTETSDKKGKKKGKTRVDAATQVHIPKPTSSSLASSESKSKSKTYVDAGTYARSETSEDIPEELEQTTSTESTKRRKASMEIPAVRVTPTKSQVRITSHETIKRTQSTITDRAVQQAESTSETPEVKVTPKKSKVRTKHHETSKKSKQPESSTETTEVKILTPTKLRKTKSHDTSTKAKSTTSYVDSGNEVSYDRTESAEQPESSSKSPEIKVTATAKLFYHESGKKTVQIDFDQHKATAKICHESPSKTRVEICHESPSKTGKKISRESPSKTRTKITHESPSKSRTKITHDSPSKTRTKITHDSPSKTRTKISHESPFKTLTRSSSTTPKVRTPEPKKRSRKSKVSEPIKVRLEKRFVESTTTYESDRSTITDVSDTSSTTTTVIEKAPPVKTPSAGPYRDFIRANAPKSQDKRRDKRKLGGHDHRVFKVELRFGDTEWFENVKERPVTIKFYNPYIQSKVTVENQQHYLPQLNLSNIICIMYYVAIPDELLEIIYKQPPRILFYKSRRKLIANGTVNIQNLQKDVKLKTYEAYLPILNRFKSTMAVIQVFMTFKDLGQLSKCEIPSLECELKYEESSEEEKSSGSTSEGDITSLLDLTLFQLTEDDKKPRPGTSLKDLTAKYNLPQFSKKTKTSTSDKDVGTEYYQEPHFGQEPRPSMSEEVGGRYYQEPHSCQHTTQFTSKDTGAKYYQEPHYVQEPRSSAPRDRDATYYQEPHYGQEARPSTSTYQEPRPSTSKDMGAKYYQEPYFAQERTTSAQDVGGRYYQEPSYGQERRQSTSAQDIGGRYYQEPSYGQERRPTTSAQDIGGRYYQEPLYGQERRATSAQDIGGRYYQEPLYGQQTRPPTSKGPPEATIASVVDTFFRERPHSQTRSMKDIIVEYGHGPDQKAVKRIPIVNITSELDTLHAIHIKLLKTSTKLSTYFQKICKVPESVETEEVSIQEITEDDEEAITSIITTGKSQETVPNQPAAVEIPPLILISETEETNDYLYETSGAQTGENIPEINTSEGKSEEAIISLDISGTAEPVKKDIEILYCELCKEFHRITKIYDHITAIDPIDPAHPRCIKERFSDDGRFPQLVVSTESGGGPSTSGSRQKSAKKPSGSGLHATRLKSATTTAKPSGTSLKQPDKKHSKPGPSGTVKSKSVQTVKTVKPREMAYIPKPAITVIKHPCQGCNQYLEIGFGRRVWQDDALVFWCKDCYIQSLQSDMREAMEASTAQIADFKNHLETVQEEYSNYIENSVSKERFDQLTQAQHNLTMLFIHAKSQNERLHKECADTAQKLDRLKGHAPQGVAPSYQIGEADRQFQSHTEEMQNFNLRVRELREEIETYRHPPQQTAQPERVVIVRNPAPKSASSRKDRCEACRIIQSRAKEAEEKKVKTPRGGPQVKFAKKEKLVKTYQIPEVKPPTPQAGPYCQHELRDKMNKIHAKLQHYLAERDELVRINRYTSHNVIVAHMTANINKLIQEWTYYNDELERLTQ